MSVPLACVRCRAKKIRCDALTPTCSACERVHEECLVADLLTSKQYKRGYIQALEEKAAYLERKLQDGGRLSAVDVPVEDVEDGQPEDARQDGVSFDIAVLEEHDGEVREPESLSKFLGDASGTQLARLIIGTMKQTTRQFEIRRSSTSPEQTTQAGISDLSPCEPNSLPSRVVADQLLKSYLKGPHIVHPFLQVAEIAQASERVYTWEDPTATDLFITNMIFAIGGVFSRSTEEQKQPILGYYAAAMIHAKDVLKLKSLEAIQCILLVLNFRIYYHSPGPSVWDLSRLAIRICIEEGLHLDPPANQAQLIPPMELQMRRRIFWDCYVLDRRSSQMLGWPFAIQDEDIESELPKDVDDHELIASSENIVFSSASAGMGEPSSLGSFLHLVRLRRITSQARRAQTMLSAEDSTSLTHLEELHHTLNEWRSSAPTYKSPRSIYQTQEWFNLSFHMEVLAVFRPFLSRDRPGITAHCLESSLGVIFAYSNIFNSKHSLYTWTYVYALYTAGLCCVFCIMASGTFESQQVKEGINLCRQTLKDIAARWPAISRHAESIDILGKEVIKALEERSDQFWKEVEEATMIGFSESIMDSYNSSTIPWSGAGIFDQETSSLGTEVLDHSGAMAMGMYNELFASVAVDLTSGGLTARNSPNAL